MSADNLSLLAMMFNPWPVNDDIILIFQIVLEINTNFSNYTVNNDIILIFQIVFEIKQIFLIT